MDATQARQHFSTGRVARLATVRPDGSPHIVPIVLAVDQDTIFTAVDAKPKRSAALQRLENLRSEPRCAVLVDHYDADWSNLWWARADGEATIVADPHPSHPGLRLLAQRYRGYADAAPAGPLIVVTVSRWSGWAASP